LAMTKRVWPLCVAAALVASAMSPGCSRHVVKESEEPRLTAPTTFNSDVAFAVYAVKTSVGGGEKYELIGTTPSDKPLQIPVCLFWCVEPRHPVDMGKVRKEIVARKIPGLRLWKASDDDLAHLISLTGLQALDIANCEPVTDAGLAHLKDLTGLQSLNVSACFRVTDAGLAHLMGLTRLQSLDLAFCKGLTDAGMEHLKDLSRLQALHLTATKLTDAALAHLEHLKRLQRLALEGTKVTDAGLVHLKGMTRLQCLRLMDCAGVTNAGMPNLESLTALQSLDLRDTGVTDAGVAELRKALPNAKIRK
jgi:hypothetical protein